MHVNGSQDNPKLANGEIFTVGNPSNELSDKDLAQLILMVYRLFL